MTTIFYLSIYLVGLSFALHFSKNIPTWILVTTSFLWGKLIWILCSLFLLFLRIEYTAKNMILVFSLFFVVTTILLVYRKITSFSVQHILLMLLGLIVTGLLGYAFTQQSYVFATADSFGLILLGRVLGRSGLQEWSLNRFTARGFLSPVFLMASNLLPGDFISGHQTILALCMLIAMSVSVYLELRNHFKVVIALALTIAMSSTFLTIIFIEHAVYIHTNLTAAILLFTALTFFWNFLKKGSNDWLILGVIALLGFSFTRIEGPLFAIFMLALFIQSDRLSYRQSIGVALSFSLPVAAWYTYLLLTTSQQRLLTPTNTLIIIASAVGLILFAAGRKWFNRLAGLPQYIFGVLILGLVATFLLKPNHMFSSSLHIIQNLIHWSSWGISWIVIAFFFPAIIQLGKMKEEDRWLGLCIYGYVVLVVMMAFVRIPYRIGRTDSANRLLLQIQPLILFFIATQGRRIAEWFTFPEGD